MRLYRPPVLNHSIPFQNITVDLPFNISIPHDTFFDPDGDFSSDELIYFAEQADGKPLPNWIQFNNQSRYFIGTPSFVGNILFNLFAANPRNLSARTSTDLNLSVSASSGLTPLSSGGIAGIAVAAVLIVSFGVGAIVVRARQIRRQPLPFPATSPVADTNEVTPLINQSKKSSESEEGKSPKNLKRLFLQESESSYLESSDSKFPGIPPELSDGTNKRIQDNIQKAINSHNSSPISQPISITSNNTGVSTTKATTSTKPPGPY